MLSPREVFLAGLFGTNDADVSTTCNVDTAGTVVQLADMLVKGEPGVYHNQADDTVLAFGSGYRTPLRSFQVYSLIQDSWQLMTATMQYGRCAFTHC